MSSVTFLDDGAGHIHGEVVKTDYTRIEAQQEKQKNQVEERFQDLEDHDIQYLIEDVKTRLKVAKLKNAMEKRCEQVSFSNLEQKIKDNREGRNLKLHSSY